MGLVVGWRWQRHMTFDLEWHWPKEGPAGVTKSAPGPIYRGLGYAKVRLAGNELLYFLSIHAFTMSADDATLANNANIIWQICKTKCSILNRPCINVHTIYFQWLAPLEARALCLWSSLYGQMSLCQAKLDLAPSSKLDWHKRVTFISYWKSLKFVFKLCKPQ